MPFVTITLLESTPAADRSAIADGIHQAIVQAGFPPSDRFQRVIALKADEFLFDRTHPNLDAPRSDRFVAIEILISIGRSVEFKRDLLAALVANLQRDPGLEARDVLVVFVETARENWAFAYGVQTYVVGNSS
ncbi:MAG TPA: tautomerase family protein [Roseiflexaceae bacterium]|nr:tautomerase family protein [Roseiflexaceae bacterium]